MRRLRWLFGTLLGVTVRLWVWTLRVRTEWRGNDEHDSARRVFAFFHGQQMALLAAKRLRRTAVLVSRSPDGDIQAGVMRRLGFSIARGSSSRGGAEGLRTLVRRLSSGDDVALAVDGPRGPFGVAKSGALVAARTAGAVLVPVASAARRAWKLDRAWDRFEIPMPFSRVAIVVGEPLPTYGVDSPTLSDAIRAARRRAESLL